MIISHIHISANQIAHFHLPTSNYSGNFLFKYKSNQFHLLLVMCSKSTNQIKITLKTSHGTLSDLSLLSIKENTFWSTLILWPAMSLPCYAYHSCHIDKKMSFLISRDNEPQQLMTIS